MRRDVSRAQRMTIEDQRTVATSDDALTAHSHATDGSLGPGLLRSTGLASVALLVVSLGAWTVEGPADVDVTAAAAQRWFVDNMLGLRILGFVSMAAAAMYLVLAVLLRRVLRLTLPDSVLGDVALAAGLLLAVNAWLFAAVQGVATVSNPQQVDPQLALGWYGLQTVSEYLGDSASVWRALFVGAVALAAWRGRFLSRPVAGFGLAVAGFAMLAELGAVVDNGVFVVMWFVAFIGTFLWLLVLAIGLLKWSCRAGAGSVRSAASAVAPPHSASASVDGGHA